MRLVNYEITNTKTGQVEKVEHSWADAVRVQSTNPSRLIIKTKLVSLDEPTRPASPKRQAMLDKYGYCI